MPKAKHGQRSQASTRNSGNNNVSVIVTVYNEIDSISKLVSGLRNQTLIPKEVVIVDGGSTDKTYATLLTESRKWSKLKVYQHFGNRSVGRNYGVSKSTGSILAFTDAGCYPDSNWLNNLASYFYDDKVEVVSGYYRGEYNNVFQKSLIPYVLVMPDKSMKNEFFPSTRSMAMRRTAWNKSGGFDTKLNHNEDYAFSHWLKKLGYNFIFAPDAVVTWIPRKNLVSAFWMFFRFSLGDIQAGIIRPKLKRIVAKHLFIIFIISLSFEIGSLLLFLLVMLFAYIVWPIYKNYKYVKDYRAFFWLPIIQFTADLAILFGTLGGFLTKK